MLSGDFLAWYWNMRKELFQKKQRREEGSMHSCYLTHCLCLLQEEFHWQQLAAPEVPYSWISGFWLTPSRLQRNRGVLDIETKVIIPGSSFLYQYRALKLGFVFSGEPPLPGEHGEKYSWQLVLLGRWMIVFCSCHRVLGDPAFTSRYN